MISVPINKVLPEPIKLERKLHIKSEREQSILNAIVEKIRISVDPRYAYKRVGIRDSVLASMLSNSGDLTENLKGCTECFVVIATLHGSSIPKDPLEALYTDRILSDMAENLAEYASKELLLRFYDPTYELSKRYSPGYGDLLLQEQTKLFTFFEADSLDVKLNEAFYMEPEKSVSYIVGVRKVSK